MDTTSINALPVSQNNIMQPQQQEQNQVTNVSPTSGYNPNIAPPSKPPPLLSNDMIKEVTNSIQMASQDGSTQLPSRDIPRDTLHMATDVQVNADHIPVEEKMRDYIGEYDDTQEIIQKHIEEETNYSRLENIYNEIQTPVLIMLLYFLFQLPVVNTMVFKVFPKLFNKDGNLNMSGLLLKTSLYGALYYGIMKGISYI
tara:strand:+ start:21368 stop:21964 length:597 start_codon:yes stop_codon:yes gene_type:complete